MTLPTVVDGLDDATNRAYGAWPDRLFVIGTDGLVAFRGEPGPRGFSPDALEAALKAVLARVPAAEPAPAPAEPGAREDEVAEPVVP